MMTEAELSAKERTIRFLDIFIPAIRAGQKTQTRRVVNPQPRNVEHLNGKRLSYRMDPVYGTWVLTFSDASLISAMQAGHGYIDAAFGRCPYGVPGDILLVEGTDLRLKNEGVRVERVQEISEEDAKAEGIVPPSLPSLGTHGSYRNEFGVEWHSINAKRGFGWDKNPWVFVIDFRMIKP